MASTGNQAFLAKYDYEGALLWVQQVGGSNNSFAVKGVSDNTGQTIVAGQFTGIAEFGTNVVESIGLQDVFVVRYGAGGHVLWVQQTGTVLDDTVGGFALDREGNAWVLINSGTTNVGEKVCQMVKYDTNGLLVFSGTIASGNMTNLSLAVDDENNLYALSSFSGSILVRD